MVEPTLQRNPFAQEKALQYNILIPVIPPALLMQQLPSLEILLHLALLPHYVALVGLSVGRIHAMNHLSPLTHGKCGSESSSLPYPPLDEHLSIWT